MQEIYGVRANTQKSQVYGYDARLYYSAQQLSVKTSGFNFLFKASASLTCIDREQHAFKRKVLSQALTQVKMKSFEPPMLENVRILMSDVLEDDPSDWSKPYDLSVTFQRLFADIMADTIFSSRWDMQTSEAKRWILDILPLGTSGLHAAGHMILALKLRIEQLLLPTTMRDVRRFLALSREQCETRLNKQASGASCQDLFSSVLRASDLEDMGGKGSSQTFTMNDIVAESGLLIVAGGDTTATAITATLFYLLRYPKIFRQVRDEIDSAFARHHTDNVEVVTIGPALSNCKLLEACVEEALRLSPPVSGLLPRQVLQGGLLVAGRWQVPAGTDVGIPSYAIHHSEVYWRHPNRFKPERWLQKESQDDRSVFMPFGVGRTSCVGKQLAYNEMALVIARILWTYDLKMIEGSQRYGENGISGGNGEWGRRNPDEFQTRDVFTSSHNGPLVRFRKR